MLFYFTVCLSSIYIINYFCVFPVLRRYRVHKNTHQCKIFHCTWRRLVWPAEILYTFKKSFYVVSVFAFVFFILYYYNLKNTVRSLACQPNRFHPPIAPILNCMSLVIAHSDLFRISTTVPKFWSFVIRIFFFKERSLKLNKGRALELTNVFLMPLFLAPYLGQLVLFLIYFNYFVQNVVGCKKNHCL